MNENVKTQTESQTITNNNKPWYKKRNTIIASSSLLGVGILTTVIAVPIALSNQTSTTVAVNPVVETIKLLNAPGNKDARIILWNKYMANLQSAIVKVSALDNIVKTPEFINEFITFLTSNLNITATGSETGAVSQIDLDKIIKEISNTANLAIFKDATLATYTNLFSFNNSNAAMFDFKNVATSPTIEFSLFMPASDLDIIYNDNETISVKISATHNITATNNARLNIKTFNDPAITSATPKVIYFKQDATIQLPSLIMNDFKAFLKTETESEVISRKKINDSLNAIKISIDKDVTNMIGLSYWNSFAINYATSNNVFLKADFAKEIVDGGMYKFLATNAKNGNTNISADELTLLKTQLTTEATNGLNASPYVTTPMNNHLLFNTSNSTGDKYSLELNITNFSYEFVVNNLFAWSSAIVINPKLELSGKLIKTPQSGKVTTFTIANSLYDIGSLINTSFDTSFTTGGLSGFIGQLTNKEPNGLAQLTKSLVALNSKPTNEQIIFWNTFAVETTSNSLILNELKKTDVLADFILNNVDVTNLFGVTASGGSLPTITASTLKTNINAAALSLSSANLSFTNPGTAAITLSNIQYGTNATDDVFATITIYFGYDANSISNINFTSKLDENLTTGVSNISLSQMVELTSTFADKAAVEAIAKKRISIVFDKTTSGSTNTSTSVAYFGQGKITSGSDTTQTTKSIIIPSTILTSATKLIDAIKLLK